MLCGLWQDAGTLSNWDKNQMENFRQRSNMIPFHLKGLLWPRIGKQGWGGGWRVKAGGLLEATESAQEREDGLLN